MTASKGFRVLFAVWLLLLCGACASFNRDPSSKYGDEQLRQMGEKYMASGDQGQALKFLTMAERRQPDNPAVHYDLGVVYGVRGMNAEAQVHFEKAISLKPDYSEAHNALGALLANQGQLEKAEFCFHQALVNPLYDTPHFAMFNMGRVYERRGDHEMALKQYQDAVRTFPQYGLAYFRMGQVLEEMRRGDEARQAYGKAIELSPDLAEAHFRYGVMSYTAGELESAFYSLSRVLKLSPHSSMATEARKYLEQLHSIIGDKRKSSSIPPYERLSHLDVLVDEELRRPIQPQSTPPPQAAPPPADVSKEFESGQGLVPPSPGMDSGEASPVAPPADTQWNYIIQVGSFLERGNADAVQKKLTAKGFDAVVKPFPHQVLGQIYVVQLKPMADFSKATHVVSQIESIKSLKPIIIKVPENL